MSQFAFTKDDETMCVRGSPIRSSLRVSSKQDHQVQAGPGGFFISARYYFFCCILFRLF
uniref:Uncharacterized protein n=1 Tax=Syphacia muris TaxID=451379 RepID=A0A0N5A9W2_9BILA